VRLQLVLAALARQDHDKGETQFMHDGVFDRQGDLTLVGTQVDAAGSGPGDGVAPDGGADAGGERGAGGGHSLIFHHKGLKGARRKDFRLRIAD